jgi:hypothetical protein
MANHHPSPTMMQMQHQAPPPGPPVQHGQYPPAQAIANMNEAVWMQIGKLVSRVKKFSSR